jgi:hypothetical protein
MAVTRQRAQVEALALTHEFRRRTRKRQKYALCALEFFANREGLTATTQIFVLNFMATPAMWKPAAQQGIPKYPAASRQNDRS